MNDNEDTIIAVNIEKLVQQLNRELERAHEVGLRACVDVRSGAAMLYPRADEVLVRVWRETVLVLVEGKPPRFIELTPEKRVNIPNS